MAKVSAHGSIVGTVEYLSTAKRYMSDGVILKNVGCGWKLHGKVKAGIAPADAFARAQERLDAELARKPALANYRKLLHQACGQSKRWKLNTAISMMPDDCDGVWSECCDGYGDNISMDVDDVAEVCRAYLAAERERAEMIAEASRATDTLGTS